MYYIYIYIYLYSFVDVLYIFLCIFTSFFHVYLFHCNPTASCHIVSLTSVLTAQRILLIDNIYVTYIAPPIRTVKNKRVCFRITEKKKISVPVKWADVSYYMTQLP